MTKNNLRHHLDWFLGSRPYFPLDNVEYPHPTYSQSFPDVLPPAENSARTPVSDSNTDRRNNDTGSSVDFQFLRPALPPQVKRRADSEGMARLQSGPNATKRSRLLSQITSAKVQSLTPYTSRPSGSTLRDQYGAAFDGADRDHALQDAKTPSIRKRTEVSENALSKTAYGSDPLGTELENDVQVSSSSTVETFGESRAIWREDSASRATPLLKNARKRKSDEMDVEGANIMTSQNTEVPIRASQGSFIAIDLYPEEDPPPYSTNPLQAAARQMVEGKADFTVGDSAKKPKSGKIFDKAVCSTPQKALRGLQGRELLSERSLEAPSSPTTRSPLGTHRSEAAPLKTYQARSKIESRVQMHRKGSIADSGEDDDKLEPSHMQIMVKQEQPDMVYPALPNNAIGLPQTTKTQIERGSVDLSGGSWRSTASFPSAFTRLANHASPYQSHPPTKGVDFEVCGEGPSSQQKPPALNAIQQFSVQSFLRSRPNVVQALVDKLHRTRRSNAETIYNYVFEGVNNEDVARLTEENAMLAMKTRSIDRLLQLWDDHLTLSRRKQELKEMMLKALEEDNIMPDDNPGLDMARAAKYRTDEIEQEMSKLLDEAAISITDISDLPHSTTSFKPEIVPQPPEPATILIQSTQVHHPIPQGRLSGPRIPASSVDINSQYTGASQGAQCSYVPPFKQPAGKQDLPNSETKALNEVTLSTQPPTYIASTAQRSPFRTYSPPRRANMDADASFSPTRQKRRLQPTPSCRPPSYVDLGDGEDDTECPFTTHMGGPCRPVSDVEDFLNDEEYGIDEDDEEILAAVDQFENHKSMSSPQPHIDQRTVLAETTGNASKKQSAKVSSQISRRFLQPQQLQYAWSADVKKALKERFHLRGFRPHQLDSINATLSGKDAFVLMPTGGGKSLCYQLPSIISSGKTRGVTVVISPLLSLMQDQVEHLQKLQIQASLINSEVSAEHRRVIMDALQDPNAERFIQLLYVTPEMVNKSQSILNAFTNLHRRKRLARIVIDEAHCVSQWGHDFRPDYKLLGEVRQQFRGVPVMALTATATENVKVDVIFNLGIENCEVFTQSFNRPNLMYEVRNKGKGKEVLESMAQIINGSYKNQSGIVYCLSRQNCENVAKKLSDGYGIRAHHYHAGLGSAEKTTIQKAWQAGEYNVIVATIAFGMGIDKPDVRFVIHHTIPKSLEGYYQETGRAGRDGKRSGCFVFYGYGDTNSLKRMIDEGEGSWEQKERQRKMLRNVIQFCENKSDCRRVQVLHYFNEAFDREDCHKACDNCVSDSTFETQDFTDYAITALDLVEKIKQDKVTLLHCVDVFRGAKSKKISTLNHSNINEYGAGSGLERGQVERMFYKLLSEDALAEDNVVNKAGFAAQYIRLGHKYNEYTQGRRKLQIQVRLSPTRKANDLKRTAKGKGTSVSASRKGYPQSTNVSSPVQAIQRRRNILGNDLTQDADVHPNGYVRDDFVISDGEDGEPSEMDDEDDAFEPIRVADKPKTSRKRQLGPPITTDEKLDQLNEIHRMIVEDFVHHAKDEGNSIVITKGLKHQPFTDTILREMAIRFPKDEDEMLEIEGIDADKVRRYGKRFLKLVKASQQRYEEMMQEQDPNHQTVIDISSDGDPVDDGEFDEFDEWGASQEERSTYFEAPAEVQAFNAQLSQIQTMSARAEPRAQSQARESKGRQGTRGGLRGAFRGGFKSYRKASGGSIKSTTSVGGNKKTSNTRKSRSSFGTGPPRKGGPDPRGFGGGIGMMPT